MKRLGRLLAISALSCAVFSSAAASADDGSAREARSMAQQEPDYGEWNRLLSSYYDSDRGMDYAALKAKETAALHNLRTALGDIDASALPRNEQLAYWINVYNVNVVGTIVDHYPVKSIRALSTDPIVRLNVFAKKVVPYANGTISLNHIEHERLRPRFRDPRIHFAINCAAKSCPPIRREAYVGSRVDEQLDEQVRRFLAGPGVRIENSKGKTVVHTTRIMDWFGEDFDDWGGGKLPFLQRYLPAEKVRLLPSGTAVTLRYDRYDWSLNDWRR